MFLRNKNKTTENQFEDFKRQILQSGKSPEQILNELLKSGKVSKQQLNNVMKLANTYRYLVDR